MDSERNSNKVKLTNQELISLYEIFHDLQKKCTDEIHRYMSLYYNANILILGGGIAILSAMEESIFKYFFLVLCGLLVVIMSIAHLMSTKRAYSNQLEYIAQTAQLEDILNLSNIEHYGGVHYFQNEGLIIQRHIDNRKESTNKSEEITKEKFVKKHVNGGQRKYIVLISWTFIAFGVLLALYPFLSLIMGISLK